MGLPRGGVLFPSNHIVQMSRPWGAALRKEHDAMKATTLAVIVTRPVGAQHPFAGCFDR